MTNVINEQLNAVLEEIELIGDTYQRADIRVKLIGALSNLTFAPTDEPIGKDAFKHDTVKEIEETETIVKEEKPKKETKKKTSKKAEKEPATVKVDSADEEPIEFESADVAESTDAIVEETVTQSEPKEIEIDTDPSIEANQETERIVIECENEDKSKYDLDITDAWMFVGDEEGSEERIEIAKNLTEYNLLPVYNTFEKLEDNNSKMMLAYYMQLYGLEGINEFIENLTEGMFSDVYEFANNENIDGLITSIEEAASEE